MSLPSKQKGVALMVVILVFALVTILSVGMFNRQSIFVNASANALVGAQAYEYAIASEIYARRLLKADWDEDKADNEFVDDLEQVENALQIPVEDAVLEAQFNDLHGRINLNDLVGLEGIPNKVMVERFERLLDRLAIETIKPDLILDWIDENDEPANLEGAEDGDYLGADPPYRTGAQPFVHISELLLLRGVERKEYELLLPHISVLPQGRSHINVNTATAEVLQSLAKGISDEQADQLVSARESKPWKDVESFASEQSLSGLKVDISYLDVYSEFFQVATRISLGDRQSRLVSVLHRSKAEGDISLVQRDQGKKYIITKDKIAL